MNNPDERKFKKVCGGCRWNIENKLNFCQKMFDAGCDNRAPIEEKGGHTLRCMHYLAIELLEDLKRDYYIRLDYLNEDEK
jgi:hypothetical protein